ncbi:MAG: ATP-binding protein [Chloroflexi bacterium]|nr:ATP-binding protein [Chloroflexota bacterium]
MQDITNDNNDLSTELMILETLVNEQNRHIDQNTLQINAVSNISDYVKSDETLLILFDFENPELAIKKLLGAEHSWRNEDSFLIKNSSLCNQLTEDILLVDEKTLSNSEPDPLIYDTFTTPIREALLVPLSVNKKILGVIVFINPLFDLMNERRKKILEIIIKGLANAIYAVEHNRRLIVSNADLEASQWEILNSRNTLRTFFDNIPSCVYIVDRSYTIMAINSRRSERVNKAPYELVGGKCYEKLFGNSSPCPLCRVGEAFEGIPAVRNLREWGPQETFIHWEITTIPIRENQNYVNQVIIFDEDITEKWILEANLIQSEKLASIGQLAANVAHEINNPLAAIIANAQLLLRDLSEADEYTVDSLKLIETAGMRAAKIVSNLLESARKEKHDEFEEVSLNETIKDAISMLQYEINNRSITIKLDMDTGIPAIFANKNQLKGVWINLITNALGAFESNAGIISISTRYESNEFRVVFADNGKGILPEHKKRIFEPFFTTKEAGKGTGLGLSVSLQVIKDHHGNIDVDSEPGKGAKFIIIIPDIERGRD